VNTFLKAHVQWKDVEGAARLLDGLEAEFGVRPDACSISTFLYGYATQANVAHCRDIVTNMQARFGVTPHVATLNTLLKAHMVGGEVEGEAPAGRH